MKVAVLGIGLMGYRMAQRLLEAGHEVHVWNRTHEREPLADLGPRSTPAHRRPPQPPNA
jgi:2-hydroxy-3-oxopropionate reductase